MGAAGSAAVGAFSGGLAVVFFVSVLSWLFRDTKG
jgi:hypothetical protein